MPDKPEEPALDPKKTPAWEKAFSELSRVTEYSSFEVYEEFRRFLAFVDYWQKKFDAERFLDLIECVEDAATEFREAAEDEAYKEPGQESDQK